MGMTQGKILGRVLFILSELTRVTLSFTDGTSRFIEHWTNKSRQTEK